MTPHHLVARYVWCVQRVRAQSGLAPLPLSNVVSLMPDDPRPFISTYSRLLAEAS